MDNVAGCAAEVVGSCVFASPADIRRYLTMELILSPAGPAGRHSYLRNAEAADHEGTASRTARFGRTNSGWRESARLGADQSLVRRAPGFVADSEDAGGSSNGTVHAFGRRRGVGRYGAVHSCALSESHGDLP